MKVETFGLNAIAAWPSRGFSVTASDHSVAEFAFALLAPGDGYDPVALAPHCQALIDSGSIWENQFHAEIALHLRRAGMVTLAKRTYCPSPRPANAKHKRRLNVTIN